MLDFTLRVPPEQARIIVDVFKIANDHFRNDGNAIWQRSQFFMAADLAVLAFFYSTSFVRTDGTSVAAISIFGLVISLAWFAAAYLSVRWINVWRHAVINIENHLVAHGPFKVGEATDGKELHQVWRPEYCSYFLALVFATFWTANILRLIHYT
jgi:protein-S-isoprenylcysteine O-methyltransferase Ste14